MNPLVDLALRSSLVLGSGLLVVALLRTHSATVRHAVLVATMGGAALAPLAGVLLPSLTLTLPALQAPPPAHASVVVGTDVVGSRDGARLQDVAPRVDVQALLWIWVGGACLGLGRLARAVMRVRAAARAGERLDDPGLRQLLREVWPSTPRPRVIELRAASAVPAPATWGLRRPLILLPQTARTWEPTRLRLVLAHEAAHIARRDWALQLTSEVLRAVYWWHPLFWMAAARLRRESEVACDELVIATSGVAPCDYAVHLVALARTGAAGDAGWSGAVPMAHSSLLERRVRIMLASTSHRRPLTPRRALALATILGTLSLALGSVRAAQSQGDLHGVVYDTTGAVVPEVEVTLTLPDDDTLVAYTSADGSFSYPGIAAGTYTLAARLPGFAALTQEITLAATSDWERDITLQLGIVREEINIVAERAGPEAAADKAEPTRIRVGGNIRAPRKLKDVRAVYPTAMQAEGREGNVTLEAIIDKDGTVRSVRVLGALVHPDFALAAADAVRQWVFSPTLLNGAPVEVVMTVAMSFRLSE